MSYSRSDRSICTIECQSSMKKVRMYVITYIRLIRHDCGEDHAKHISLCKFFSAGEGVGIMAT